MWVDLRTERRNGRDSSLTESRPFSLAHRLWAGYGPLAVLTLSSSVPATDAHHTREGHGLRQSPRAGELRMSTAAAPTNDLTSRLRPDLTSGHSCAGAGEAGPAGGGDQSP